MKRGKILCLALALALVLALPAGCGPAGDGAAKPGTGWDSVSPGCLNDFSLRLLRQLDDGQRNIFITPWSVAMTLGTVRLAATGAGT
jgi:hypothetical protein